MNKHESHAHERAKACEATGKNRRGPLAHVGAPATFWSVRFRWLLAVPLSAAALLLACSDAPKAARTPVIPGDEFYQDEEPIVPSDPDTINPNGFAAGERAAPADDAGAVPDASSDASTDARPVDGSVPVVDAGPLVPTYCSGPLALGDLIVTELLISSRAGSGDDGEWVELTSTRTCTLRLGGLVVESPRGTAMDQATLPATAEVAPLGKILVVGTTAKAAGFALPEPTFVFSATDVLKNDGDRITVRSGLTIIDRLDYPAFSNLTASRSIAFPKNCPANVRTDWARWSLTFSTYASGAQRGTPGRDNTDVTCY